MNITIKNLKHTEFASHETHCFEATLYIDGKPLCKVDNDGNGGSDMYYPLKGNDHASMQKEIDRINAELGKETIEVYDIELPNSLELVVGDLIEEKLQEKAAKKALKRIVYINAEDGTVRQLPTKYKPSEKMFANLKKASWWNAENIILNEIPFDEAKKHF